MSAHPYADLHLHSNHSDGGDAPEAVVARAAKLGVAAISITDHDQVSANPIAAKAAAQAGITYLNGTELTARYRYLSVDVLGYRLNPEDPALQAGLARMQQARLERFEAMIARLHTQCGIVVDRSLLTRHGDTTSLGRMHLALALKEMGVTRRTQEGFDRFLKAGRPAYVPAVALEVDAAIDLIHQAGGLAFLAHPGLMKGVRKALLTLLAFPFDGIEVYHVRHSPGLSDQFLQIARERKLLISGGSDCHGHIRDHPNVGKVRLPMSYVEAILNA